MGSPIEAQGGFTPGPWEVDGFSDCQLITKDMPPLMSGPVGIGKIYGDNMIANARLIAASPDLLEEIVEARTTLSILRTQIMVEIGRCADPSESRWEGVPEKLKQRIDAIDTVTVKATGGAA